MQGFPQRSLQPSNNRQLPTDWSLGAAREESCISSRRTRNLMAVDVQPGDALRLAQVLSAESPGPRDSP